MDWSAAAIVIATVMGPILAVQAQKYLERHRDQKRAKDVIFRALMATRANRLTPEHGALGAFLTTKRQTVPHARGLLKGPKFNGKHSTVIPTAVHVVEAARDCPYVTKIALGVITPIRASQPHLKFSPVSGGLKMQVRGTHAVQIFWLYTTRPEDVIREIEGKWLP